MRHFFQKSADTKKRGHPLLARAVILLPILFFIPQKAEAAVPVIIGGLVGLLGSGLKGAAEGAAEAAVSLGLLALSVGILSYIAFSFAKFLLWLAATTFNWSIETMVFGFSNIFGTSDGMLLAWSTLRDLGNILLLFGFLYIGLQMILNIGHHSASKALPRLLIAAVLINFSLFASGAIVDTANGLSSALYAQSTEDDVCQGAGTSSEECRLNNGIAGQILGQMNIISVVSGVSGVGAENTNVIDDAATYFSNPVSATITFVMLAILVTLASVVLFAGTLLIISRGITLAFLLVVSPIGFVGMAIEGLHGISERWWKSLIDNALFAPTFLILLFVGLRLTDTLKDAVQVEGGLVTGLTSPEGLSAGPVFLFVLVIGFMVASLTIARGFGIAGSEAAMKFATSLGTSSFLPLRGGIFGMKGLSQRSEDYGRAYERRMAGAIRRIPFIGKDLETAVGGAVSKTFESGKNMSLPGWDTRPSWDDAVKKRGTHLRHAEHEAHLAHEFDEAVAAYATDPGKMKKFLADNSLKDLKTLGLLEGKNGKHLGVVAEAMGADRFKEFMKDQEVPDAIQKAASTARKTAFQNKFNEALREHAAGNPDKLVKLMKDTKGYDVKSLSQFTSGGAELEHMMNAMPVDKFKEFVEDTELPSALRKKGEEARKNSLKNNLDSAIRSGNQEALEKIMRETSDYDLARAGYSESGGAELERMARGMSSDKFAEFYRNKEVPSPIRERYKTARFREFNNDLSLATAGDASAQKRIRNTFTKDIIASGALDDPATRADLVRNIDEKQYGELRRNPTLGDTARDAVDEIRYGVEPGSRFDASSAQRTIDSLSNKKDITRAPIETLSKRHVLDAMTPAHFYELANSNSFTDTELAPIMAYVQGKSTTADMDWAMYVSTAPPKQLKKLNDRFGTSF